MTAADRRLSEVDDCLSDVDQRRLAVCAAERRVVCAQRALSDAQQSVQNACLSLNVQCQRAIAYESGAASRLTQRLSLYNALLITVCTRINQCLCVAQQHCSALLNS
jgi:hypothetical protein